MNNLTTDIGFVSLNKYGEILCGDNVEVVEYENSMTMVLADGLGSGVKANILSILTSKIIATMMANGMSLEECVKTIASTLPQCKERQLAYSTFSIIQVNNNEEAVLIQFDNPLIIMMRNGENYRYQIEELIIDGKKILKSIIKIMPGDIFITLSDGAIYAGVGQTLNYGWQRDNIIKYIEARYFPEASAKLISTIISEKCKELYADVPGDDTTVATVKVRNRQIINLMIGPPIDILAEKDVFDLFFSKAGKKIICGGTTATIIGKYLNKPVITCLDYQDPDIPPIGKIDGIDLVTEGIVTLSRVLKYAENFVSTDNTQSDWNDKKDAASLLCQALFVDATDINIFVGTAINPAHQTANIPINFDIKIRIIKELTKYLEQIGKKVKLSFY
ncbi:MAG: SpoIIE family protein phosphatase [Oscillospiraceae bacterium]